MHGAAHEGRSQNMTDIEDTSNPVVEAHKHSIQHRKELADSDTCGCFYCLSIFDYASIDDWCDEDDNEIGQTALCPRCGIDSVIGTKSGFPITKDFLGRMKKIWFYDFVSENSE